MSYLAKKMWICADSQAQNDSSVQQTNFFSNKKDGPGGGSIPPREINPTRNSASKQKKWRRLPHLIFAKSYYGYSTFNRDGSLGGLQHTTTHCNIPQHPATSCNTLQHGMFNPDGRPSGPKQHRWEYSHKSLASVPPEGGGGRREVCVCGGEGGGISTQATRQK